MECVISYIRSNYTVGVEMGAGMIERNFALGRSGSRW